MEKKSISVLNQKRAFLDAVNDLSAEFVIQESLNEHYRKEYNEKIERALINKDKDSFIKYTTLLNKL